MAGESREIGPHDHLGIPAKVEAVFRAFNDEPMVLLDAVLKSATS
jgi:hypothetical protein